MSELASFTRNAHCLSQYFAVIVTSRRRISVSVPSHTRRARGACCDSVSSQRLGPDNHFLLSRPTRGRPPLTGWVTTTHPRTHLPDSPTITTPSFVENKQYSKKTMKSHIYSAKATSATRLKHVHCCSHQAPARPDPRGPP